SAFAMLSTHRLKFMEGEDSAQVLVRFDSGAVGQMVTSWAYQAAPGTDRFSVVGEKGSLRSDGSTLRVQVRGEEEPVFEHEQVETFSAEIAHFVDCLIAGARPIHTEVEGVSVLGVILAADGASRTGKMADVASPCRLRRRGADPRGAGAAACGPGPPGRPGPAWPGPPGPARLAGAIRVLRVEDRCSGEHRSSTRKTVAEGPDGRTAGRGPPAAAG